MALHHIGDPLGGVGPAELPRCGLHRPESPGIGQQRTERGVEALGVTVLVFQDGWLANVLGVQKGPIEAWVPVIMFAVVFGLSMDYEVFLI